MADMETGLQYPVGVYPDEKSVIQTTNKITKDVLNQFKDGHLDVPVALATPFDKNNKKVTKELIEAQAAFIDEYNQLSAKGFSASAKELKSFVKLYDEYKRQIRNTGQTGSKQNLAFRDSGLNEVFQSYKKQMDTLSKDVAKSIKENGLKLSKTTRNFISLPRTNSRNNRNNKKYVATDTITNEEIENDIKRHGAEYNNKTGITGYVKNLKRSTSYKMTSRGWENVDRRLLNLSNWGGAHESGFARSQAKTEKASRQLAEDTLTEEVNKEKAEQLAQEALNKIKKNRKPEFVQQDNRQAKSRTTLTDVASVGGELIHDVDGVTGDTLKDAIAKAITDQIVTTKSEDVIKTLNSAINSIKNMTTFRFDSKGYIGITPSDDSNTGEGPGMENWSKTMKEVLTGFTQINRSELIITWETIRSQLLAIVDNYESQLKTVNESISDRRNFIKNSKGLTKFYAIVKTKFDKLISKLTDRPTKDEQLRLERNQIESTLQEATKNLYNTNQYDQIYNIIRSALNPTESLTKDTNDKLQIQTNYDKINNSAALVSNDKQEDELKTSNTELKTSNTLEETSIKEIKRDADTGFNTDENTNRSIDTQTNANSIADQNQQILISIAKALGGNVPGLNPASAYSDENNEELVENSYKTTTGSLLDVLQNISENVKTISDNVFKITGGKKDTTAVQNSLDLFRTWTGDKWGPTNVIDKTEDNRPIALHDMTNWPKIYTKIQEAQIEKEIVDNAYKKMEEEQEKLSRSNRLSDTSLSVYSSQKGFFGKLAKVIKRALPMSEADRIMNASAEELARIRAERTETYGLNNGRNLSDTGDIASVRRTKELFGWIYRRDKDNNELFQDIKLTPGIGGIDTTNIMKALNKVLSGPEMFRAQTGGVLRNFIGMFTGYIGMPSIEKTRAQAEGLNQVMADVRNEVLNLIQAIKADESTLRGMEKRGTVKFNDEGEMIRGTSASRKIFADMEERKGTLKAALAEVERIDKVVARTGGRIPKIIKQIGFVMPELMQNNTILQNLNAGLDKNGKALKFQSRFAENLNYVFQLMARHVGQILKNWMLQLNPLYQINKLFQDFASYDPKWQRTMNVIKYNLRDIIRPFMEWIAQTLVNIIGFLDIISMKIQEAFGYTPISLFDQENADEMKKTYEEISDVSASFDELHDVGSTSSENDPNNLLGEIYKPQLSQAWKDLANEIGDLFAGIITGDLGFSEVMLKILDIAWKGVKTLWNEILWPFIKNTIWPAIKDNWLEILAWILGAFVAWKGLKLIGQLLWNAISGAFIKGAGTNLLKNLFTDSNGIVGIGRNLGTLIAGGILTVISTMALTDAINDAWNQGKSDANTGQEMNLNDRQTNMDALKGALGGAGAVLGGGMIATALGASVALGPLLAVAAGVAALSAVVVVGAEAWAYHSQQNKIANNEMLKASDYAEQAAATQEKLNEVTDMVNNGLEIKNSNQEKLNQLEEEYGISLDYVNQKVEAAGGNTSILTEKERALYEQGKLTQESIDNYNRLLEIQIELQKQQLWQKEQEAIALDMEAGNYELATLRIEQAELQGLITTEEATAKRIQLYKTCGEEERANLLQNLTPEQRTLMAQYTNATDEELAELAKLWRESSEDVKQSLLDGVGPEVQAEFERRMDDIDKTIKEHQGFWQGVGDTLKEIFTAGNYTSWTYNGEEKYYKEGYDKKWAESEIQSIQNDDTLSEEEKRRRIQNIRNMASYAVGTNYVPNDGLAYLHQGEAVIPKKYNQPYQPASMSPEEIAYMNQMMNTMRSLDNTMKQGITVNGQFVQRGSDLVSVINRTKSQSGADLLSNVSYAR